MRYIFSLLCVILLQSCKPAKYVQVLYTESSDTKISERFYTFENDTMKITYDFNISQNSFYFTIYNKLNRAIYIDWSKSVYNVNNYNLKYTYDGKADTNQNSYIINNMIKRINPKHGIPSYSEVEIKENVRIKPLSEFSAAKFHIYKGNVINLDKYKLSIQPLNEFPESKTTKVYEQEYTEQNSPLHFSNTLTFYFTQTNRDEFTVKNSFHVTRIKEMVKNHFWFQSRNQDGTKKKKSYTMTHSLPTSFYIEIDKKESVEGRSKN